MDSLGSALDKEHAIRAGIALGSNLGNRLLVLRQARDRIVALGQTAPPILQSAVYRTLPVGCEPGAPDFYNAVMEIGFAGSAGVLLRALKKIEAALGREREHGRNLSRTIDLDLLYFGEQQHRAAELEVPHPRMREREFVLRPLAEIVPNLRLPGETASIRGLLARIRAGGQVQCVTKTW